MQALKNEVKRLYKPKNPVRTTLMVLGVSCASAALLACIDMGVQSLIGLLV